MYSEENERLAEAAYTRFRATADSTLPEWAAFRNKHVWRDLVQTFEHTPRSHVAVANPMEQCVSDVLKEKKAGGIPTPAPVVAESEQKPAKAKGKK